MIQKRSVFKRKFRTVVGPKPTFRIVNSLLGRGKQAVYPKHTDSSSLASVFNNYFVTKININLTFLSKLIEKVIAGRLFAHLQDNGIMEKFQFAYKTKHSTETALLRVYNDVMLCIDQGKGCILVLLDLSAVFDTVDHAVLLIC